MPVPAYPVILLAANWNGKKSLAAKILFPTKLGDELKAFENAYKTVQWNLAYNIPPDNSPLKLVDDQIMNYKTVFKGELGHLIATANIAKTHAIKIRGEWSKNPLVSKDLKTYLDSIIKNFDPLLAKIEHDTQENFDRLLAIRAKIAAANPKDANAALQNAGTKVIARDKNAPKSDEIKTKFKPQPPATKPKGKESESDESESEGSVPPPPGTKPPRPTTPPPQRPGKAPGTPPPPPPKRKESESRESESTEGGAPGSPGTKTRASSSSTPPPPPGRPPGTPPKAGTSSGSSPKPPATPPPSPPKRKESESRESESSQ